MTPAQRKHDIDLAVSMHRMANWIEPKSRKISVTLKLAAERITALVASAPIEQPASTPDEAQPNR